MELMLELYAIYCIKCCQLP
uniref:Uncharacterized protein n=1 Tax=Amphimedon queenslandica TaxID=400682 RepID=A0A1X7TNL1_AMPQE